MHAFIVCPSTQTRCSKGGSIMATEGKKNNGRVSYRIFSEGAIAGIKTKNRLVRSATFEAAGTHDGGLPTPTSISTRHWPAAVSGRLLPDGCRLRQTVDQCITRSASGLISSSPGSKRRPTRCTDEAPDIMLIAQIGHAGRKHRIQRRYVRTGGPFGSAVADTEESGRRALTLEDEIEEIIGQFC